MYTRNVTWLSENPIISDPLLLTPDIDNRKCIALVAKNPVQLIDITDIQQICEPLSSYWMRPKVHSTFMVLRGWSDQFINEDWTNIKEIIRENIPKYEIIFDRVIPVKTGLVLCGTPSIDINNIRDKIRNAGYETNVLYKCDIAHTTLLRWTHNLHPCDQQKWLQQINQLPRKPYAKITVTGFDIILASWSMYHNTTQILDSIDIEGIKSIESSVTPLDLEL